MTPQAGYCLTVLLTEAEDDRFSSPDQTKYRGCICEAQTLTAQPLPRISPSASDSREASKRT